MNGGKAISSGYVAPHTGAWIETLGGVSPSSSVELSHPTRVRGLKLHENNLNSARIGRTPHGCVD